MSHFLKLDSGETIFLEVRRHLFVFYAETLSLFVAALLPLFFIAYVVPFLETYLSHGLIAFGVLYSLWLLIVWIMFFVRWTDYYLDVWIITNKRVFDIEQKGLFNRTISVFQLDRIQDITVDIRGVIATILKFGDVHIHTAGENLSIIIKNAANPVDVKNKIMEVTQKSALQKHV